MPAQQQSALRAAYEQALLDARIATQHFRSIQEQYRARQIDDSAYLSGRKTYEAACAAFDAAYSALENNPTC